MKYRLMDYLTGDCIREATAEENRESGEQAKVDGGAGVITVSDQGERRVYVEAAEARVTGRDDVSQVGVSMAGVSVRCPMCGGVSAALDDGTALLCYNCTMDKARRADERAVYGGAEL